VLQPLLLKLVQTREDLNAFSAGMGMGGFGGGRGGGRGGGMGGPGGGMGGRGGMMGATTNSVPEAEALQKAIDSSAGKTEMKAALEKFYTARKAKETAFQQAQEKVRPLLTPRQEAVLALQGYL
jgi:hypothetical protein